MNQKLLIILIFQIFYNGVTYSSPLNGEQASDVKISEEKPLTVSTAKTDSNSSKIEAASPTPDNSVPHSLENKEIPVLKNAVVHQNAYNESGTIAPTPVDKENVTNDAVINNTSQTTNMKNVSSITEKKNITKATDINTTVPPGVTVTVKPAEQKTTTAPTQPTPDAKAPTVVTSATATTNASQISSVTPTVSITSSTSAGTKSVVVEQNTPATQEKHFDGTSFIGGIVLTIGLTAIGFIAFKYYKSGKIDMNYRTL